MKIDTIDKKILKTLQKNAKITNARLSKEIGLSPAPTLERVRKLETRGIISGYHAKLDKSKIYLIYCRSGNRSSKAATIMDSLGFKKTIDLEGGFLKW